MRHIYRVLSAMLIGTAGMVSARAQHIGPQEMDALR